MRAAAICCGTFLRPLSHQSLWARSQRAKIVCVVMMMWALGSTYLPSAPLPPARPEFGIEAQAVEHAKTLVPSVKCREIECGRAEALAIELAQDRAHLRLKIGACGLLALLRGVVEPSCVVDRRESFDRHIARRNIAILGRGAQRRGVGISTARAAWAAGALLTG